jgi:hypothetical protein
MQWRFLASAHIFRSTQKKKRATRWSFAAIDAKEVVRGLCASCY